MRNLRSLSSESRPWMRRRRRVQGATVAVLLTAGLLLPVGEATAAPPPANPDLGSTVIVFSPDMPLAQIQASVNAVAAAQLGNQFGTERYSLFFRPGVYGTAATPLTFDVGYYTQVAGLGREPGDVTINGSIDVHNQCDAPDTNCLALNNFWRSLANLTIDVAGGTGCQANTEFWAVSQASPMRRVTVNGGASLMDYCSAGPQFASGGFIADSTFTGGQVVSGSQQQFLVRNSNLDGWSNGVWNQVFSGTVGAPAQSFGTPGANPYTTIAASPVSADAPYLYTEAGKYRVMVPTVQHNSVGPSSAGGTTAGTSRPIKDFFIARPGTSVAAINLALFLGKDLILTPGVYRLDAPIIVSRPGTVVLGLGFATLIPQRGRAAMTVLDVPGTKISGLIFDAGPKNSPVLLQVGTRAGSGCGGRSSDPTQIQDVFFRIGGAGAGKATTSLVVNSSNVILDDIWAWRADHGTGVGWTVNTADTGVVVNGDDVTAYGLFVEHFQKTEVIWNGRRGTDIFFQNEMPYDPPSQAAWNLSSTFQGYPAFVIGPKVKTFQGYGMGSYSFFNQGVDIFASTAFQVPQTPGVQLHDLLTVYLNGKGGIRTVINGAGGPVAAGSTVPSQVINYPVS